MSKESLIKSLSIDGDILKGLDKEKLTKLVTICNALNFSKYSGQFDKNGKQIKENALDITKYQGTTLREVANALNICQRARD